MKANEFFNDMRKTARAWDKTSDFPYTSGAMKALYAWESRLATVRTNLKWIISLGAERIMISSKRSVKQALRLL